MTRLLSPAQRRRLLELPAEIRDLKAAMLAKHEEWADLHTIAREQQRKAKAAREEQIIDYLVTHTFSEAAMKFFTSKGAIAGIAFRHGGLELIRAQRGKAA